jgi:hypothetical protein
VNNAGGDPVFLARIDAVEGVFARDRGKLDEAVTKLDEGRAAELAVHDLGAAMQTTILLSDALIQRDRPDDLALAWQRLVEVDRLVTAAKRSRAVRGRFDEAMLIVAELRGDLAAAHAAIDRLGPLTPPADWPAITGRVVDREGKPVANATVVAWTGTLFGDASRIRMRLEGDGDSAITDGAGKFTVRATPTGAIIAEVDNGRSRPQLVGTAAPTLVVEPTRTIAGMVASDREVLAGGLVIAKLRLSRDAGIAVGGPIARDKSYKLAGIPTAGELVIALDSIADPNRPLRRLEFRPGTTPRWPIGPSIDAIVHKSLDAKWIWVLRGRRTAKTRAEVDALFAASTDAMRHDALIVGVGDQTVEAMPHYAIGDHHARFIDNAPGELTVCVAGAAETSPAICKPLVLRGTETVVPIEFP